MVVTILGAGTLLPDDERRSPAHLVETGRARILLDCGSGVVHGMARHGVDWRSLTHVAISHFHTDHTGDLAALLWALRHGVPGGRSEPLTLLGPPGLRRVLAGLALAHGGFDDERGGVLLDPGFQLRVVELERGAAWRDEHRGLEVRTHPTPHTAESIALRVEADGVAMGYTGDTGPDPSLGEFFRGVELLVAECALPDEEAMEAHLTPASVGALLAAAAPPAAVLTHMYPGVDSDPLPARMRAAGFRGRTLIGRDGMRLSLPLAGGNPELPGRR